jgi:hypothetical protein
MIPFILTYFSKFPGYSDLFEKEEPFVCTLKVNLKKYQHEKYEGKYHPGKLIYTHNDSLISKSVRIKARGVIRRKICAVPPIRLNIQKVNKQDKYAFGLSKIKLVTHCHYNANNINYLFREFLVYKLYNIVTDKSFRVRLIKIVYIDTGRKNKQLTTWAFALEPQELLAERLGCISIKMDNMGYSVSDSATVDLLALFQYMIGNTDYSIMGRHNVKLIKSKDHTKPELYPIPYDFDYSGVVNAHYALPGEGLGIESVRERLYAGPCRDLIDYHTAAQHLVSKQAEFKATIESFEYLEDFQKNDILNYIDNFFRNINRPNYIKYHIDPDCL